MWKVNLKLHPYKIFLTDLTFYDLNMHVRVATIATCKVETGSQAVN